MRDRASGILAAGIFVALTTVPTATHATGVLAGTYGNTIEWTLVNSMPTAIENITLELDGPPFIQNVHQDTVLSSIGANTVETIIIIFDVAADSPLHTAGQLVVSFHGSIAGCTVGLVKRVLLQVAPVPILPPPCTRRDGVNGSTTFPLHAVPLVNSCLPGEDPCQLGPWTNIAPAVPYSIFLVARNFDSISGLQTAFDWDGSWNLIDGDWACQLGSLAQTAPSGPGPTDGTLTVAFNPISGGASVIIGRLDMQVGDYLTCLTQVESSMPGGTIVCGPTAQCTPIDPYCGGRVCTGGGGTNTCEPGELPVSVELVDFAVTSHDGQVCITWRTTDENNNLGFHLRRASNDVNVFTRVNREMISGTSGHGSSYRFVDKTVTPGETYRYRLEAISRTGDRQFYDLQSITVARLLPKRLALRNSYPNPFNATTRVRFDLPEATQVALRVYNVSGRCVRTLVAGKLEPDFYSVTWDGRNDAGQPTASGVYIYQLKVGDRTLSKKMVLAK